MALVSVLTQQLINPSWCYLYIIPVRLAETLPVDGAAASNLHVQCAAWVCVKWESGNCNKYDCIHLLDAWSLLIWGSPGKTWVYYQERAHISKVKVFSEGLE